MSTRIQGVVYIDFEVEEDVTEKQFKELKKFIKYEVIDCWDENLDDVVDKFNLTGQTIHNLIFEDLEYEINQI